VLGDAGQCLAADILRKVRVTRLMQRALTGFGVHGARKAVGVNSRLRGNAFDSSPRGTSVSVAMLQIC